LPSKTKLTTPVPVVEDMQALQEAFVELVGERWGYYVARRVTQQDMTTATKDQAKAIRELVKTEHTAIEEYIETPSDEVKATILETRKTLKEGRKALKEARAPFMQKMAPLAKAVRYCDNVAIPDSLKELGHPIQPRFSLSDWAQTAIAQKPKK